MNKTKNGWIGRYSNRLKSLFKRKQTEEEIYREWLHTVVNTKSNILIGSGGIFENFKYVFSVDTHAFLRPYEPFVDVPICPEFFKPTYDLDDLCIWVWFRSDCENGVYTENELFGTDRIFVATNNPDKAVPLKLMYGTNL